MCYNEKNVQISHFRFVFFRRSYKTNNAKKKQQQQRRRLSTGLVHVFASIFINDVMYEFKIQAILKYVIRNEKRKQQIVRHPIWLASSVCSFKRC